MNPRKLAEEALSVDRDFQGYSPPWTVLAFHELGRALIAQADLLEEYRGSHDDEHCVDWREHADGGSDDRCKICRAYDKLMEEK